ncbi:PilC/PilY family type IV pilus protein [Roseateles koreensis]|uniref:PilC/PilY family type IV pilus protein n=1 Tax=Roseateles koreensis TaxID=2987526 RepID=A0ABT5KSS7_9BURK|nr:PilC/PilY family type IV pilus protein [Roseateles koreensis]MDC8785495.1 PilC/PilY family type IV pilus protein [Roseateles koreensis]
MKNSRLYPLAALLGLCLGLVAAEPALAATDIATAPLFTTTTTNVKPNLMYLMDDSGSMAWDFMPDDASFGTGDFNSVYGRRAAQCNGVAFNSDSAKYPYTLPVDASGNSLANASTAFLGGTATSSGSPNYLTSGSLNNLAGSYRATSLSSNAVVSSGSVTATMSSSTYTYTAGMVVTLYGNSSSTYMIGKVTSWNSSTKALVINVAMSVGSGSLSAYYYVGLGSPIDNVYYTYSGTQTALNYLYPNNALNTSTTFYKECNSAIGSSPGAAVFTANIVTPGSDIAQRYANWYYYYSIRISMLKTSMSLAFSKIDNNFRVGFSTINETTALPTLGLADFDATQKTTFYSKVNAIVPNHSTPLRAGLAKMGRYYAKKLTGQTVDPVQYSCQKNFTILSTDGYWNGSTGEDVALDGTSTVGQQDAGTTLRPMYDGGVTTATTTKTWKISATGTRTIATTGNSVSTTSSSVTTTTTTPHTTKTYSLTTPAAQTHYNITGLSRCSSGSPCPITVTTSTATGYTVGTPITVSVGDANYDGNWTVASISGTTLTFNMSSRPSRPTSTTGTVSKAVGGSGCPVGQGYLITATATYNSFATSLKTTTLTTTTPATSTSIYNLTQTTPMTEVITVVNGVQSSDVTTAGTVAKTQGSLVSGPTIVLGAPGQPQSSVTTTPGTLPSSSPVAATGSPSTGNTCTASPPTNTDTTSSPSNSTGATVVGTPTGPTFVAGNGTPLTTDSLGAGVTGPVTTTTSSSNSGGSSDSLADVAMYYYMTDLRDTGLSNCTGALGTSVCDNNVPANGLDSAQWQHMTTFTMSLGVNGTFQYDPNYETQASGDFYNIVSGRANWPVPDIDAGAVNIDDLWHAAVNGRGHYFSAKDPATLSSSLLSALNTIKAVTGTSSAAATSTLQPVTGNNGVYIAQFTSSQWTGDLRAYTIDPDSGAIVTKLADGTDTAVWSAASLLSPTTTRNIYYFKSGSGNAGTLRSFTYDNLKTDSLNGLFDNACSKTPALTQCGGLTGTNADPVNSGSNMVSFLSGQAQSQYRTRTQVLGDIVNSSPVYVGAPGLSYSENAYATFQTAQASRAATLYVGANDGMLHAFDAKTGVERWAYIPGIVMPKLYQLADQYYQSLHQYYVDATPVVGDVYIGGAWKTILVGGLNAGGAGYYALDITNPNAPVALWEFKDSKLGLSFGNPVITKRKNGAWVVAFTSGYNNADGGGHLFMVDAGTGALLQTIDTGAGSAASPSGLNKLNAWVDSDIENLATRFYAGDLLGNIWRFDTDGLLEPKNKAFNVAQLLVAGVPQPITTQPQLGLVTYKGSDFVVAYVGTGEYLGKTDVSNTAQQSIYAVKDALGTVSLGDVRASGTLVKQTLVTNGSLRTVDNANPVDWTVKNGWYVDLPSAGERVNIDMQLAFNILTAAGNIPGTTATDCTKAGDGTSWLYQLDILTGKATAQSLTSTVAGLAAVMLNTRVPVTIVTKTDVSPPLPVVGSASGLTQGPPRRSSWRELID